MSGPITLQHVAEASGVSAKTVSRVVNGDRYVSEKTREIVRRAIDRLGYRPNLAARSLVTAQSYMIGMVSSHLRGFYYSELHAHAHRAARAKGYFLLVEEWAAGAFAAFEEGLRQMRLDGVILTAPVADDPRVLDLVERMRLSCVRISPGTAPARSDAVSANEEQGMAELAGHLVGLGHRRFGVIASPPSLLSQARHEMLARALVRRGVDPAAIMLYETDMVRPATAIAREATACFLAADPRPTAIFAFSDALAVPIVQFARERGLRVPEDLSVAGFDDSDMAEAAWPPLTTVHQPIREMAAEAVALLLSPRADATRHLMLATRLVVRASTGPAAL